MFTGLIEEIGKIKKVEPASGGKKIKIGASVILDDLKVDDSVAVNGICLTATKVEKDGFWADAVGATLEKTSLAEVGENVEVNLERALRFNDRLGGHLVQGHVNGLGEVTRITKLGENYYLEVSVPEELEKHVIDEGSIAIDGISLTIASLKNNLVGVSVIPHTWKNTNLINRKIGDKVNIETDMIAKYVEKLLNKKEEKKPGKISESWLKEMGY
ncbi:MAG: riboflavin synthase [Ignavibacteria bacterium]|jgi:riboflavin synthase